MNGQDRRRRSRRPPRIIPADVCVAIRTGGDAIVSSSSSSRRRQGWFGREEGMRASDKETARGCYG